MREPANKSRGEVLLTIDGRPRRLCLTLGALAELETAFEAQSLTELSERLTRLNANDMVAVLAALTAGGGEPMSALEVAQARIDPKTAAAAVAETFRLAFDG